MAKTGGNDNQTQPINRRCHRCHGSGRLPCQICRGTGQVLRITDARGRQQFDRCGGCFGIKTTRCYTCGGDGYTRS
jgi:DnaJ-class molecular chaperone